MQFSELSYANPAQPKLKRWLIRSIEGLSGRDRYLSLYQSWRTEIVPTRERIFGRMLDLIDVGMRINGAWPPEDLPDGPLVIVANHPFGIGDGIAILSLAERLNRPFRVMINNDLLQIPEMEPYALPVSFDETKEALQINMTTRKQALSMLAQGVTIVVFPAGGVATAPRGFGQAQDLPWKMFPARLIQQAQANVIPIYFNGQNGPLFHLASKLSMTLRISLLIREFRRLSGRVIDVRCGSLVTWHESSKYPDRKDLIRFLHGTVFALATPTPSPQRALRLRFKRRSIS
jgi:putative hemolysin